MYPGTTPGCCGHTQVCTTPGCCVHTQVCTTPGCCGHTRVCTRVLHLVVVFILGYVPGYYTWLLCSYSGMYAGNLTVYTLLDTPWQSFYCRRLIVIVSGRHPKLGCFYVFVLFLSASTYIYLFIYCRSRMINGRVVGVALFCPSPLPPSLALPLFIDFRVGVGNLIVRSIQSVRRMVAADSRCR
ncbi:unnamed protein product [Laminaria digitata]